MVIVISRPMVPKVFCLLAKESACSHVSRRTHQSNLVQASSSGITGVCETGNDLFFFVLENTPAIMVRKLQNVLASA